jgi:hypothetical protein
MTRVNSIKDIGAVYASMKQAANEKAKATEVTAEKPTDVVEEKAGAKLPFFPEVKDKKIDVKKITAKGSDKKAFVHKDSGPANASGFNKNIIDPRTAKENNHYTPQKFSSALEKTEAEDINNGMSKSIFDKLYEDVMKDDALDLGIQAGPEGEAGDTAGDKIEGSEEVTLTLPRDVAQKLHDMLMNVLGAAAEDKEEDLGGEDLGSEEDKGTEEDEIQNAEVAGEATAIEELPDSKGQTLAGKNNKVPSTVTKAGHGKGGDSKVTDKVGNDGDKGHALVGSGVKGGAPTSVKGKANVVSGVIKGGGKGDQSFFQ